MKKSFIISGPGLKNVRESNITNQLHRQKCKKQDKNTMWVGIGELNDLMFRNHFKVYIGVKPAFLTIPRRQSHCAFTETASENLVMKRLPKKP